MLIVVLLLSVLGEGPTIDTLLHEEHQRGGLTPAALCDDDTFFRRLSLDLRGRIPHVHELEGFRAHPDRSRAIDAMLEDDRFSRHFAEWWTASLIGYGRRSEATDREVLAAWLARQVTRHRGFDEMTQSLIAAEGESAKFGPVNFVVRHGEDAGVQVCRQFLGISLGCARCHDHPFAKWTQDDFHAMQRFFQGVQIREIAEGNVRLSDRPMRAEEHERPRFLSGARPHTSQWRSELALMVTRSKPFARNYVNRLWYHLMGRGIVHPPDDFHDENPPVAPRLLEYLAEDARQHRFDIRHTVRLICQSDAYQRRSDGRADAKERTLFAHRQVRPLTPEQLFDSEVTALAQDLGSRQAFLGAYHGETFDEDFLRTWKYRERIQTLLDSVTRTTPELKVESIELAFQRALSRPPREWERQACRERRPEQVLFDLVFTNEFFFNH